ncbi:hypothetical protein FAZ15_07190 [Sphingobacterium olei]|uniref:Uncharacterized protein n=1 Tax=Sphingobacterium olei TaxID=2571155 RepID=A0A4U0P6C6_9SPHI|nr:hypothetical protein [Sphingobacterium olei]TJZ62282.1 hypothetical protein FAZ15_07190 [Sphingobacterium olei]
MLNNFLIEIFLTISGVSAASGLHYENNSIFLIADNSNYLYTYLIAENRLEKRLLYGENSNNELLSKASKLDLESIFKFKDTFYLFGSASTKNRNHLFKLNLGETDAVMHHIWTDKFKAVKESLSIADEDLNIEGSFIHQNHYYLFNRGNGPAGKNGIILIDLKFKDPVQFFPVVLPRFEKGIASFTDAILIGNSVYFLAAIEDTQSTYEDGEKGGSLFGKIDLETKQVQDITMISTTHKFEGITLMAEDENKLFFLLCEDPDDESLETTIYKLTVQK